MDIHAFIYLFVDVMLHDYWTVLCVMLALYMGACIKFSRGKPFTPLPHFHLLIFHF